MTASSAIADVQSRIASIQARFPAPAGGATGSADRAAAFAGVLASVQSDSQEAGGLGYALDPTARPYGTPSAILPETTGASALAGLAGASGLTGTPAVLGAAPQGPAAYAAMFSAAESRNNLPAGLLNAIAKHESSYNPNAVSPAGARGLMQIMPATAQELGVNPMNPAEAIDGAARLLASNLRQFKSVDLAVAAYNAGAGAVSRHGGIPPYAETRAYVQRVLGTLRGA